MDKLDGTTFDTVKDNMEKMKALFPEIFTDGKLDMDKFMLALGERVEQDKERFGFTWNGKSKAIQMAQKLTTGTLRPWKEESVNWDTTQNIYVEGDNLEALRILQTAYRNKVKMIYIDPPYNTGKDFVYNDDYHDNIHHYKKSNTENMKSNPETNGRFHTDWLNMIYPRMKIAKNVMRNDGVIFVHIDEHEYHHLLQIMNELFGEENYLGTIVWDKLNPKGDAKSIAVQHEYIVCFAKNKSEFTENQVMQRKKPNALKILNKAKQLYKKLGKKHLPDDLKKVAKQYSIPIENFTSLEVTYDLEIMNKEFKSWINNQDKFSGGESAYSRIDENGEVYQAVSMAWPNNKQAPDDYFMELIHPVTQKPCPTPQKGWRNPSKTMKRLLENGEIIFGADETTQPRRKYYLKDNLWENVPSVISTGINDEVYLRNLGLDFDNPKPHKLAKDLISFITNENDIVLDFFAGSGTTADAVMELNAEDNQNRRFMLIQMPEETEDSNISSLCMERIKRSGKHTLQNSETDELDIGFKAFTLDETNLHLWDEESNNVEKDLIDMIDPVKEGRTQEDVVYEILLKFGIDLSVPLETKAVAEKTVYDIDTGDLLVCLERDLTLNVIEQIAELKPARVVFYDEGFQNDTVRANAQQILKKHHVADVRVI